MMVGIFRRKEGQAMVEMALVLPLLLLLFMGIVEFGRILGAFLLVNNLARDGVRFGVVGHSDSEIENFIRSEHAWLDPEKLLVYITPPPEERSKGSPLKVEVNYPIDIISPFLADILPNPVPVTTQYQMRIE